MQHISKFSVIKITILYSKILKFCTGIDVTAWRNAGTKLYFYRVASPFLFTQNAIIIFRKHSLTHARLDDISLHFFIIFFRKKVKKEPKKWKGCEKEKSSYLKESNCNLYNPIVFSLRRISNIPKFHDS